MQSEKYEIFVQLVGDIHATSTTLSYLSIYWLNKKMKKKIKLQKWISLLSFNV